MDRKGGQRKALYIVNLTTLCLHLVPIHGISHGRTDPNRRPTTSLSRASLLMRISPASARVFLPGFCLITILLGQIRFGFFEEAASCGFEKLLITN